MQVLMLWGERIDTEFITLSIHWQVEPVHPFLSAHRNHSWGAIQLTSKMH
jgi:hypothetical protein